MGDTPLERTTRTQPREDLDTPLAVTLQDGKMSRVSTPRRLSQVHYTVREAWDVIVEAFNMIMLVFLLPFRLIIFISDFVLALVILAIVSLVVAMATGILPPSYVLAYGNAVVERGITYVSTHVDLPKMPPRVEKPQKAVATGPETPTFSPSPAPAHPVPPSSNAGGTP